MQILIPTKHLRADVIDRRAVICPTVAGKPSSRRFARTLRMQQPPLPCWWRIPVSGGMMYVTLDAESFMYWGADGNSSR